MIHLKHSNEGKWSRELLYIHILPILLYSLRTLGVVCFAVVKKAITVFCVCCSYFSYVVDVDLLLFFVTSAKYDLCCNVTMSEHYFSPLL